MRGPITTFRGLEAWTEVKDDASEDVGVDLLTKLEREGETRGRRMSVSHPCRLIDEDRGGMSDPEVQKNK